MLRRLNLTLLQVLRGSRLFALLANSGWRRRRLLILCYHGIAIDDEDGWRPGLYMRSEMLEQRLQMLKEWHCAVLPLDEALERLHSGSLPPRSVALTFDDGGYDFYKRAYPLLKAYGYPVTVYQTTYYCLHRRPIFHLICSYMLWKRRNDTVHLESVLGPGQAVDLRTEVARERVVAHLVSLAERKRLSGEQRDELAGKVAEALGLNYSRLASSRILQLMTPEEIRELSADGVSFQLHTHRHRTPLEEGLFRREIRENREALARFTGVSPVHFCYPSGDHKPQFLPWLAQEQIVSGTTCDSGLAYSRTNSLLLPRFVDTGGKSVAEVESWISGVAAWLSPPRRYLRSFFSKSLSTIAYGYSKTKRLVARGTARCAQQVL